MGERIVHFLFFEHRQETLFASIAFYLSVLLLINASGLAPPRAAPSAPGAAARPHERI